MVTDAMIVSRYVGSTIIVASHKKTKMENLKQIKRNIENVGGKVAGVIINKLPLSRKEYGKSYYYEGSISTVKERKKWIPNPGKLFNNKVVEDTKIEEVKQKLDKVDEKEINRVTNEDERASEKEQEDIGVLLKQLAKYLENK